MTIYTSYVIVMTGKKGWYYFAMEQKRTILLVYDRKKEEYL